MEPIVLFFVLFISLVSYQAFRDWQFDDRYVFDVDGILVRKEYIRLLSSGFLHVGWWHLILNMVALYSFGVSVEAAFGLSKFFLIYFTSLLAGNLLALYIHRNHGDYRAAGASGAISGVIYARIVFNPDGLIGFIFVPPFIPSWIFGILFVMVSIYGIKAQKDNIGHEAHLGGALAGMLLAIAIEPKLLVAHGFFIFIVLVPTLFFLYLVVKRPEMLLIDNFFANEIAALRNRKRPSSSNNRSRYSSNAAPPKTEQDELDALLDKVNREGMENLTEVESRRLEELSRGL